MPRNGVTREQVIEAAERLLSEAKPVTVTAVRTLLGETGSYTTITTHLRAWREQTGETARVPKDLERSVLDLLHRAWRALLGAGTEARNRVVELESEVHSYEADLQRLKAAQAASDRQVAALQAELERNERVLAAVEEEMAAIHREQHCLQAKEEELARRLDDVTLDGGSCRSGRSANRD